ncbi:MAG: hypothetical protein IPK80_28755 [Nannocystis sp.]|nr:hypothetical protein [Nannocystis sp.]
MRRYPRPRIVAPLLCALVTSSMLASAANAAPPPKPPVARRYIAILKNTGDCPTFANWTQTDLFGLKADENARRGYKALQRFCRYQWASKNAEPEAQPKSTKFSRVDPDYDVLVPQGSLAQDTDIREALNQIYRVMLDLGPINTATPQPLYTSTARGNVAKVAVIDTAGGPSEILERAKHGRAMAEVIHEVRCPARETECRSHLSFYNAFPWQGGSSLAPALPNSSLEPLGSLGSLAEQIYVAVSQWRAMNSRNNTDAPLILNLSLGWDPGKWAPGDWGLPAWDIPPHKGDENLALKGEWPATAQAVHAALVYASCFDVLVIAAAGNSTRGAEVQTGALAPGKWEKLLAPTEATCRDLFGDEVVRARRPGNPAIKVERSPLVYAVRARMTGNGNALPVAQGEHLAPDQPRVVRRRWCRKKPHRSVERQLGRGRDLLRPRRYAVVLRSYAHPPPGHGADLRDRREGYHPLLGQEDLLPFQAPPGAHGRDADI